MKRTIQSVLCVFLSPLLVAQQVQQGTVPATTARSVETTPALQSMPILAVIPDETKINIGAVDVVSIWIAGSPIQFTVVNDVVIEGVVRIPAGTPVNGIVSDAKRGSHTLDRDGQVTIRARDLKSGGAVRIRPTGIHVKCCDNRGNGWNRRSGPDPITVLALVTLGLLILAFLGGDK